ncbi:MAG: NAD-dependent deacylase [Cyclobacteriaceae bacterium]|nr:NAD-dependent deacylase [Cyclobacteriaceae bacterium]
MKKLVVLTGAGISAESGLSTFRDSGGLWEGHDVMTVASPEGWKTNPELVLKFYNERRKKALEVKPNAAHVLLAELEDYFDVSVITQNVDDLHEKAGSTHVVHLHGSLFQSRSTLDERLVYAVKGEINMGDVCEKGSQLRPHIVWFGEHVPMIEVAANITSNADIFAVIGTSLLVYPAAGLINYTGPTVPKYIIDPKVPEVAKVPFLYFIPEVATKGVLKMKNELIRSYY